MKFKVEKDFTRYMEIFKEQNSILNLISQNDEKFLWEKHIYDSLSIKLFFDKYPMKSVSLLDIGTGGGFPAVPIALEYPEIKVTALDSIRKKINAIENIKQSLDIKNLTPVCSRAENLKGEKFDIITSRAVASMDILVKYAYPLLKKNGYFIAYKSKRAEDEIEQAQENLKKYRLKHIDSIGYTLPLEEIYDRKLLIFQKTI